MARGVGVDVNERRKADFEGYCRAIGGAHRLPAAPDGPRLEAFSAFELAGALECELRRAGERGHAKISVHLDLIDAAALAAFLRRAVAAGVC